MNKQSVSNFFKNAQSLASKHSPEILTGIGIAGMVSSTVLAVKATPKALDLIARAEDEKFDNGHGEPLTKLEVVKAAWKPYIPAAITCVSSIACLIGASSVNSRRNAALATAYKFSEAALAEYKDKVIETIGEKKERTVRDKVAEKHVKENPVSKNEVVITQKGETLCYDHHSGRYFKSDIDRIKKAEIALNKRMITDMYVSLNEFYDELGLQHTPMGDELGWNIDHGIIDISFSSQIADDDTPCIVIDHNNPPRYGYSHFT